MLPDEPTTPEQWQVIAWGSIALFLCVGGVGFVYSLNPPPDKLELATQLRGYSLAFCGLAAAIYGIKRLVEVVLQRL